MIKNRNVSCRHVRQYFIQICGVDTRHGRGDAKLSVAEYTLETFQHQLILSRQNRDTALHETLLQVAALLSSTALPARLMQRLQRIRFSSVGSAQPQCAERQTGKRQAPPPWARSPLAGVRIMVVAFRVMATVRFKYSRIAPLTQLSYSGKQNCRSPPQKCVGSDSRSAIANTKEVALAIFAFGARNGPGGCLPKNWPRKQHCLPIEYT